jgi:sulfate adenylyltransferase subunit 2
MKGGATHLASLESESIHIIREVVAEAQNPVMLFSAGKDSTVMAHLAIRAFYPSKPPFPLLHVDSTWEFQSLVAFRDDFARQHGFQLIAYTHKEGRTAGINLFDDGDRYTVIMRNEPLKTVLGKGVYGLIFGGARRDEEKSRVEERVVSIRSVAHAGEPRAPRAELWRLYDARLAKGQTARGFSLTNWMEADIRSYTLLNNIALALRWPQSAGQVGGEDKLFPGSIMPPVAGSTPSPGYAPATVSSRSHCMSRRAYARPAKNVAAAYYNG